MFGNSFYRRGYSDRNKYDIIDRSVILISGVGTLYNRS